MSSVTNLPLQQPATHAVASVVNIINILARLLPFVEPADAELTDPMDLINAIYPRVRLAHDIAQVENGSSWDYCKAAAIDLLNKTPRWIPIHEDTYAYQLGCVPPHFQHNGMTMTGEAYTDAWHLTLLECHSGRFWCCMLRKSIVTTPAVVARIPFADIPMLGLPETEVAL